jgi:hypothetical protein
MLMISLCVVVLFILDNTIKLAAPLGGWHFRKFNVLGSYATQCQRGLESMSPFFFIELHSFKKDDVVTTESLRRLH